MGIFDRFPYSSTHEMNLDFMLGKATEIAESLQEIDTHKDQAEQAATNAAQSAQSAAQAAQAAAASQTAASASAAAADQHKTDAEDAADRAEAASNLADEAVEQAQTAAQTASTAAQNASTAADGAIASATAAETRINNLAASLPEDFTALNNEVNSLESGVNEITGNEIITFTDPADGYYIPNNVNAGIVVNVNTPSTSGTYAYAVASCTPGEIFTISGKAGNAARLYSFLDSEYKLITKAASTVEVFLHEIIAPENAAYLVINSEAHNAAYRGRLLTRSVANNTQIIESLSGAVFINHTLTQAYFESLPYNGYLKPQGDITASEDWHTSDYIEFYAGAPVYYSVCGHSGVATIMFYDSNKNIVGNVKAASGSNVHIEGNVIPPTGTVYLRYSVRIDNTYSAPTDYITYYTLNNNPVLKGKTWNVLGDSITANPAYASHRYFELIEDRQSGMNVNNYGIGGSTIGGSDANAFCNRYNSMAADADIITVFGGVNDYGHSNPTPLGQYGDSTNATFYGALKILIEGLVTKYPYSLIMFMTPIQPNYANWTVGLEANSLGFTIYDYADAIIKMCGRYGVPVVDLCRTCGFTSRINAEKTKYFYDGLHLNNDGHNKISYLIESAMVENAKGKIIDL